MELHERLTSARPIVESAGRDPFAEVKNRIHFEVIGELGPQLFAATLDPFALRDRVTTGSESPATSRPTSSATARSSGCSPTTA